MTLRKKKYFNIKMNQGHFEPEASIPKFWQKKKLNEPTSMQKIEKNGLHG